MGNRVIHFEVQADDLSRAKEFYEKTFGWQIDKMDAGDGSEYWGMKTGEAGEPGISGGMYKRPEDKKINSFDCTIMVEDIDKAIADIKANGGTITREKYEMNGIGWLAMGRDTEDNSFGLIQPTTWQPK